MPDQRVSDELYARAVVMPVHAEEMNDPPEPEELALYLDSDARYRWYRSGFASEVSGATLRTAIEAARLEWDNLQIVEASGHAVTSETQNDIPERYAADDLEKIDRLSP